MPLPLTTAEDGAGLGGAGAVYEVLSPWFSSATPPNDGSGVGLHSRVWLTVLWTGEFGLA